MRFCARAKVLKTLERGGGNRTLVFSLEGFRRLNTFNAYSDKRALNGPSEPKRLFGAVRMTQAISVATTTTTTKNPGDGKLS
jgi:hypothetical protein